MPQKIRQYVGWGLIGLLLLWIIVNFRPVEVSLLIPGLTISMPKSLLILLSAAMGAGAVFALKYIRQFRREDPPQP